MAKKVAASLQAVIKPEEEKRIERKPTSEILAYDLLMKGIALVARFTKTKDKKYLDSAHHILDKAIATDPNYGRSYYCKGHAYLMNGQYDSAFFYAERAIDLSPENGYGYQLMGTVYSRRGNLDLAIEYHSKAIELS